jgi:hypothetical protein
LRKYRAYEEQNERRQMKKLVYAVKYQPVPAHTVETNRKIKLCSGADFPFTPPSMPKTIGAMPSTIINIATLSAPTAAAAPPTHALQAKPGSINTAPIIPIISGTFEVPLFFHNYFSPFFNIKLGFFVVTRPTAKIAALLCRC